MSSIWTSRPMRWIAFAALLVLALTIEECRVRQAQHRAIMAQATLTNAQLEAAGLRKALATSPKEVIKFIPTEVEKVVKQLVEKKVFIPVAGGQAESKVVTLEVPSHCPDTHSTPVQSSLTSSFLVGVDKTTWQPWFYGQSILHLWDASGWKADHTYGLSEEDKDIQVTISNDVLADLKWRAAYKRLSLVPRNRHYWRTGWSITGGLCYSPRGMDPCVSVGYGIHF